MRIIESNLACSNVWPSGYRPTTSAIKDGQDGLPVLAPPENAKDHNISVPAVDDEVALVDMDADGRREFAAFAGDGRERANQFKGSGELVEIGIGLID